MAGQHWNGGEINHKHRTFLEGALGLFNQLLGDVSAVEGDGFGALSGSLRLAVVAYEQRVGGEGAPSAQLNIVLLKLFQKV